VGTGKTEENPGFCGGCRKTVGIDLTPIGGKIFLLLGLRGEKGVEGMKTRATFSKVGPKRFHEVMQRRRDE